MFIKKGSFGRIQALNKKADVKQVLKDVEVVEEVKEDEKEPKKKKKTRKSK